MILIPEIETIAILTPRTGSGSAYRAIVDKYPNAIKLYRHMEADGVPQGYDRWEKVGVVRDPIQRLWSLYKFLKNFSGRHPPQYIEAMRKCVTQPFSEWITDNQVTFTSPYDSSGKGEFYPEYSVRHPIPENKKSQFIYLRPDLGTKIYQFNELDDFADRLGITLENYNKTDESVVPEVSKEAMVHITNYFKWDILATA